MYVGNTNAPRKTRVRSPSKGTLKVENEEDTINCQQLAQWKQDCQNECGCELIMESHLNFLSTLLIPDHEERILALEIILLLTSYQSNKSRLAAIPGFLDNIDKLRCGSLSQKKLADEVYERLLDTYLLEQANNFGGLTDSPSKLKLSEKPKSQTNQNANRSGKIVQGRGDKKEAKNTSVTVNLFIENLDDQVLSDVEACLLKTKGVISFFSDVEDQKVVVRLTSQNITDDVIANIYDNTKHRSSIIKGDFDSSGLPLYLEKPQKSSWWGSGGAVVTVDNKEKKSGWFNWW